MSNDIIKTVVKVKKNREQKLKSEQTEIGIMIEWFIHMVLYAIILIIISLVFPNTVYIDNSAFGLWALLAAILISFLNQTIKPIIVWLTLPLTGLTLGLFYPFINLIILKLVSILMMGHFEINGIFFAVIVSIIISIFNIFIDNIVFKVIRKGR